MAFYADDYVLIRPKLLRQEKRYGAKKTHRGIS